MKKQTRVIINGRFLTQKVTGVQRYAREICLSLDHLINKDEIWMAVPPETDSIPQYQNIKTVKTGRLHKRMWEHFSFPAFVRKQHAVSLNFCNVAPIVSLGIACIHDVKIKVRPQDFSRKFLLASFR